MKLAVTGAANCGKTTLVDKLAAELDLPRVDEEFHRIIELRRKNPAPAELFTLLETILREKQENEAKHPAGFVADRSPVDLFCVLCSYPALRQFHQRTLDFMKQARAACTGYDYLIIPPWGNAAYNDLQNYLPGTSLPAMNPWSNLMQHSAMVGTAIQWLPADRILLPPADAINDGQIGQWIASHGG